MIALPNIIQAVVATYACSRIGAIASMIHPKLSADEFGAAFDKLKPKVVFLSDINQCAYYPKSKGARRIICHFCIYDFLGFPAKQNFRLFTATAKKSFLHAVGRNHRRAENGCAFFSCGKRHGRQSFAISRRQVFRKNAMLAALPMFHGFGLCVGVHASISTNMRSVLLPIFRAKNTIKVIAKIA